MPSPEYTQGEIQEAKRKFRILAAQYGFEDAGAALKCALTRANARIERLTDLARHQRGELFETGLISAEEYAELVVDSHNGKRVARLEGYDEAIKKAGK